MSNAKATFVLTLVVVVAITVLCALGKVPAVAAVGVLGAALPANGIARIL